jgi:hypothetical protein
LETGARVWVRSAAPRRTSLAEARQLRKGNQRQLKRQVLKAAQPTRRHAECSRSPGNRACGGSATSRRHSRRLAARKLRQRRRLRPTPPLVRPQSSSAQETGRRRSPRTRVRVDASAERLEPPPPLGSKANVRFRSFARSTKPLMRRRATKRRFKKLMRDKKKSDAPVFTFGFEFRP